MKRSSTKTILTTYWQLVWQYPVRVTLMLAMIPVTVFVHQFVPPLIAAHVLNRISSGDFTNGDIWGSFGNDLILYALAVIAGNVVVWRVIIYLNWTLQMRVVRDANIKIFNHLINMSATFHANNFGGALVAQANKFVSGYIRLIDTFTFNTGGLICAFIFTAVILWPKAPLYVFALVGASLLSMVCAIIISRKVRNLNEIEADASNKQTGLLADAVTNVMAIKGFAAGKKESHDYTQAAEVTKRASKDVMWATTKREVFFSGVGSFIDILALGIAVASVVLFGADVATVFLILTYTANLLVKVWDFSNSDLKNYNRALADAQAMTDILNTPPSVVDPAAPLPFAVDKGVIELTNVSFRHADARRGDTLFEDLNLQIAEGEKIGLVGHSGSGKTTLTKLLLRFDDIDGGSITIDGQNIAKVAQDDLRGAIAYVPQEPMLFHRSIRENIAYGRPNATLAEIKQAAQRAHAAEFIDKLPNGYKTMVGERGVKLSGGQRQRIAIARAMLKDAPILVLDEATSALDSESERFIQDALWQLMQDRTALVIAHRLSTVQRMDRIVVLEDGKIVEQGTHAQLLAHGGTYAMLWAHQSGGFIEE